VTTLKQALSRAIIKNAGVDPSGHPLGVGQLTSADLSAYGVHVASPVANLVLFDPNQKPYPQSAPLTGAIYSYFAAPNQKVGTASFLESEGLSPARLASLLNSQRTSYVTSLSTPSQLLPYVSQGTISGGATFSCLSRGPGLRLRPADAFPSGVDQGRNHVEAITTINGITYRIQGSIFRNLDAIQAQLATANLTLYDPLAPDPHGTIRYTICAQTSDQGPDTCQSPELLIGTSTAGKQGSPDSIAQSGLAVSGLGLGAGEAICVGTLPVPFLGEVDCAAALAIYGTGLIAAYFASRVQPISIPLPAPLPLTRQTRRDLCDRPGNSPTRVLCFSLGRQLDIALPSIALHILVAQAEGYPSILTYSSSQGNRNSACSDARRTSIGLIPSPAGLSCDEYPFNTTFEGGANAAIFAAPQSEQSKQGGLLGGFFRRNFAYVPGTSINDLSRKFLVLIVP